MEFEEEEEDLLSEKSDLNIYLNKVCSDYQCHNNSLFQQTPGTLSTDVKKVTDEGEIIESDIADQVHIVLLSKLILDEDRNVIEEIYSRFKIVKTNLLKNITRGSFSMLFMVLGMYFYYALGAFVLLFISVYYAFRATDCLWQNHYRKKQLEKLMDAMRFHYKTVRKVMKFIIENDCMLKACSLEWARMHQIEVSDCKKYSQHDMFNARLKSFNNLKSEFINTETKCIKIFIKYTNILVKLYPLLYDFLNDVHLCNDSILTDINSKADCIKLHDAYLLTQSEFLQRLIYCLIPNIHVLPNKSCKEIQLIINKITNDFEMLTKQLNSKFKYVFIHGVHANYSTPTVNVEETDIQDKNQQQLLMNLHDVSKTLQNLLITTRTIESHVENGIINVPQVEEKLLSLKNDLKTCQSDLDDSFIFLKRVNSSDLQNLKLPTTEEESKFENCIDNNQIHVGFTDLDPNVNDEIFEAYIPDVDEKDTPYGNDFMMDEERDRKRLEKEYSRHVLKELKTKLIIKAKEWEMREAKILKEKGLSFERDDKESGRNNMMDKDQENILPSENWPLPSYKRCKKPNQNKKRKNKDLKYNEGLLVSDNMSQSTPIDNRLAEKVEEICINNNTNIQQSCISENAFSKSVNMNLLSKSILEARKEILNKDFIDEETFCASGENSEEEILE